ncbi:hypothetical protein GCM10009828_059240 [Actinoplanes couchii]
MTVNLAEPAGPSRLTAPVNRPIVGNQETRSVPPSKRACRPSAELVTEEAAASGGP